MPKTSSLSVVPLLKQSKKCKPFILDVKVVAPEAGYRFAVVVEKGCTAENDPVWKLVFDLYKKLGGEYEEIVHVSFKTTDEDERKGAQKIVTDGLSKKATKVLKEKVFPVVKQFETKKPTKQEEEKLRKGMRKALVVDL